MTKNKITLAPGWSTAGKEQRKPRPKPNRPAIPVTGFWMRNTVRDGFIEILVEHDGKWITVFGPDGPGPAARDLDQNIDHMVHAGGINNLLNYGSLHPIKGRKAGKSDRREGDRRADKRRTGDKLKAKLAARKQ